MGMIFCFSGIFPGLPLQCLVSAPRVPSRQSTLILSLRTNPQGLSLCAQRLLNCGETRASGKCQPAQSLWWIFSSLPSERLACCVALWGSEASRWPRLWGGALVCRNFSSFITPSQGLRPPPELPCLPFCFIFCPTLFWGDWFAFQKVWGPLSAFRRCSVGIVPHADDFFIYLWGRRSPPCPVPQPCYSSLLWVFLNLIKPLHNSYFEFPIS